jgi:hypothetical protein
LQKAKKKMTGTTAAQELAEQNMTGRTPKKREEK